MNIGLIAITNFFEQHPYQTCIIMLAIATIAGLLLGQPDCPSHVVNNMLVCSSP